MRVRSAVFCAAVIAAALSLSACGEHGADPLQQKELKQTKSASQATAAGGDPSSPAKADDDGPNKMEKLGSKTKDFAVATKDVTTDKLILAKIKAKFLDDSSLKGCAFNVDIKDNVVTLKGFATSEAAKDKAETMIKETKGVSRVVNEVVVAK